MTEAHQVEKVSWSNCRRTLLRAGLVLPTEAQWEYAARGETRTVWSTGNDTSKLAAAGNLADQTHGQPMRVRD